MRIGTPRIYSTTSNSTIKLSYQNPLILYNIKILALNASMNTTFTITEQAGNQWSFVATSGTEITFKKVNFSSIALSDPTTYNVFYAIQAVYAGSYDELTKLEQESDVSIVPIDNVIITSPLSSDGRVEVYNPNIDTITGGTGQTTNQWLSLLRQSGFVFPNYTLLTTTPLGANASYSSYWYNYSAYGFAQIHILAYSDQNGTLYLDFSDDQTHYLTVQASLTGGSGITITSRIYGQYFRIRYVNGATAQTIFLLSYRAAIA